MNSRILITMILAFLLLLSMSGCTSSRMGEHIESAGDALEARIDKAEDALEHANAPAPTQTVPQAPSQTVSQPPAQTAITREEAERIALEHAGFTADQVSYLRTEYEIDDGRPQYEVEFHQDRWEYDYEIDADTGAILSYDRDD